MIFSGMLDIQPALAHKFLASTHSCILELLLHVQQDDRNIKFMLKCVASGMEGIFLKC